MEITIFDTPDQLAVAAARFIYTQLSSHSHPLLCAPSGDTPAKTYEALVELLRAGDIPYSDWSMLALDEWVGMNTNDEGSCGYSIKKQLLDPLEWPSEQTCFFDGRSERLTEECARVETYLNQKGPITVAMLGLGLNGHIGLNEPGTDPLLRSHVSTLSDITAMTGQKYFEEKKQLTRGITLGLANLMESSHILLLVTSAHKRTIVEKLIHGSPHPDLPCTILKQHPSFHLYLDKLAAGE